SQIVGERERVLDQIARVASPERDAAATQFVVDEPVDDRGLAWHTLVTAVVRENLHELLDAWRFRQDLVAQTAEERLIHQIARFEVGGKHHEHLERKLELLTGLQRQEVAATLEWNDPPVEEVARGDVLTSEVVDDQHTAVGNGLD